MIYSELIITKKGLALIAKLQAKAMEKKTILKYVALGSGADKLTSESVQLSDQRQTFEFDSIQQSEDSLEKIIAQASPNNMDLAEGYTIREIGIFAEDPDEGDVLYAVVNTESESGDYDSFPKYSSEKDFKEIIFHFEILVANTEEVVFDLTQEALRRQVQKNMLNIEWLTQCVIDGTIDAPMATSDGTEILAEDGDKILATIKIH